MAEYIERRPLFDALYDAEAITAKGINIFRNFPTADVRPVVRGKWYWDKDGVDWGIGAWRCSACKATSPMWWNADRGSPMRKSGHYFCPNCGAMMEES